MRKQILKLTDVYIDKEIYPREEYSQATVNQYKKDMKFGAIFPNIWVAKFKNKYYLVDGLHRLKSKEQLGEEYINANIQENLTNKLDIYLASIRANISHGRSLSVKDKLKVAKQLKKMKVDLESISKLLHINEKNLEKIGLGNIDDIRRLKVTQEGFSSVLRDKPLKSRPVKKSIQTNAVDDFMNDRPVEIMSKADEQYAELNAFASYLKDTEILKNKLNKKKLVQIHKEIAKILTRMRKIK